MARLSADWVPEGCDYPPGDMRVSDAERDRAVSELSAAFQAGRLSAGEFGERSGWALGARTGKELAALLADLPPDRAPVTPAADLEPAARRSPGIRVAVGGSAVAAVSLGVIALADVTSTTPDHRHAGPGLGRGDEPCHPSNARTSIAWYRASGCSAASVIACCRSAQGLSGGTPGVLLALCPASSAETARSAQLNRGGRWLRRALAAA